MILLSTTIKSYAQKTIEINLIIKTDSLKSSINIINSTQKTGTVILPDQNLKLKVAIGDTLIFSAVNIQRKELIIDERFEHLKIVEVFINEKIDELDEVRINRLTGNLEIDMGAIETFDKYELNAPMSRKDPPTQIERKIYTATTGPGGTRLNLFTILSGRIPVDPLLNSINGRTKKLKEIQKLELQSYLFQQLHNKYPTSYFTDHLGISELDISSFIINCITNEKFPILIESINQPGLNESLKENAKYFKYQFLKEK